MAKSRLYCTGVYGIQVFLSNHQNWVYGESLPIQDEPEKLRQLVYDWDMQLIMNDEQLQTIEQVEQFLGGSEVLEFRGVYVLKRSTNGQR